MSIRNHHRGIAGGVWLLATALLVAAFVLVALTGHAIAWLLLFGFVQLSYSSMGALLGARLPGNLIGWLFLAFGLATSIAILAEAYSLRALDADALPAGTAALAFSGAIYGPVQFSVVLGLLLLFPDGRLPSPRWRPVAIVATVAAGAFILLASLSAGTLNAMDPAQSVENPYVVTGTFDAAAGFVRGASAIALLCVTAAALVSLILRFRYSSGTLRLQLKWFVGAATLVIASLPVQAVLWQQSGLWASAATGVLFGSSISTLPLATGLAILRYRLYEIDVIIRRTVTYMVLVVTLGAGYLTGIWLLGSLLRSLTGASGAVAVTVTTLAVWAAFQPLRRRVQTVVDRRFARSRYDAAHTLDAFGVRLRDQVDLEALKADMLQVVHQTVQPGHATLWMRTDEGGSQ